MAVTETPVRYFGGTGILGHVPDVESVRSATKVKMSVC